MRFTEPWLLLTLPVVWAFVLIVAGRGSRTVPARQHRQAVATRLLVVTLLGTALANPLLVRPVDEISVYFVVDRSASISSEARQAQDTFIEEALAMSGASTGILVFGADSRVDSALGRDRSGFSISTTIDGSATDLAAALQAVASLLPTEGSRRVVVLSDGVLTQGNARTAARELAEDGIAVDVIQLESNRGSDVLVEQVELPTSARRGDQVPVTIRMRSNTTASGELTITSSTSEPMMVPVDLEPGLNEVTVSVSATTSGILSVGATLQAGADSEPQNNTAEGLTRVLGPASVLIVEGRIGEADELSRALTAGGITTDIITSIPTENDLLLYDALVLVNVPAPDVHASALIAAYVEDFGRGLLVIGGDQSYGMGGYGGSPLESVLPVQSSPEDLVRRQPVAEVFVIDTSGSMGACHCNVGSSAEGGVNKTDISRAGANLAIEALEESDLVGVVAVSSGTDWVLPLGPKPSSEVTAEALGGLHAEGDTEIANGLQAALDELQGVDDALKHIVLFTDGWDPNDNGLLPLAREIADQGITLSVLGTGEGPGTTLQRMAAVGGGRYYPGADLDSIPEIFVEETLTVSRNLVEEGIFPPILGTPSRITDTLTQSPSLLGYVLTKPKGTASIPLFIGQDDPLLATWQRGLGKATAWTSDATSRWSASWVTWEGYVDFWGAVVRDVLPAGRDNPPEVRVTDGALDIRFDAGEVPLDAIAIARVRLPNGETATVPMPRTGTSTFEGTTPATAPGAYWVSVTVDGQGAVLASSSSGAVSSYQEEFAFRDPDVTLARDLAEITGGRVGVLPSAVFDPAPRVGNAETPIWTWLTAIAMVLFFLDVSLRRLVFSVGDAEIWKAAIRSPRDAPSAPPTFDDEGRLQPPPPPKEAGTAGQLLKRKNR